MRFASLYLHMVSEYSLKVFLILRLLDGEILFVSSILYCGYDHAINLYVEIGIAALVTKIRLQHVRLLSAFAEL